MNDPRPKPFVLNPKSLTGSTGGYTVTKFQLEDWKGLYGWDISRADGRLERVCEHGVGHPVAHLRGHLTGVDTVHGCCGCCRTWPHMPFES